MCYITLYTASTMCYITLYTASTMCYITLYTASTMCYITLYTASTMCYITLYTASTMCYIRLYTASTMCCITLYEVVQRVNKAKFLDVIVDQHLNWKDHISMISQKMSNSWGIISRIRNTLDIKSKRLIYYSIIHT